MAHDPSDEVRYRLLKRLADDPSATQRELAQELGISLGKANYCLKALVSKGLLKARNFKNSERKSAYLYVLTPKGLEEKINITLSFLNRKQAEYDLLAEEIERLKKEVRRLGGTATEEST